MAMFIRKFRDWLKNPGLFRKEAAEYALQQQETGLPADERSIWALVEQLLQVEPDDDTYPRLQRLGAQAAPALIRAIGDPRFDATKIGSGWAITSRLQRVLEMLSNLDDPAAAEAVTPLIRHEDQGIRKAAARILGGIGNDACSAPVATALRDSDSDVRAYAMMGIGQGIEKGRCTRRFLDAVFEPLVATLDSPPEIASPGPASLLLQIDRTCAATILLGERFFSSKSHGICSILEAMNAAEEKIPADRLLPLLESLAPRATEHPFDGAYGQGLIALAQTGYPDAEKIIRTAINTDNGLVQLRAADALVILKGAEIPREYCSKRIGPLDFDELTEPQQICYGVNQLNMEVNNGGFSQYFFNTGGNYARETLAGLRAIKATHAAALLEQAIAVFGPAGPSPDREKRQDQLAAFSEEQDRILQKLDSRFFEYLDNLDALMSLYAAEHPDHFRASP